MAFWSQSADPRRFRSNSRSSQPFRDTSPDSDMFFDSTSSFGFPRGHLADRIGSSVFEDFPTRRTMRSFPSRTESPTFGSLHRHRPHATWTSQEDTGSPQEGRTQFFQRTDGIPVHVTHESRQGSRSSTPESTASGHSRPGSNGTEPPGSGEPLSDDSPTVEGLEEHPGVSARQGKPSFTARRQPKIHHIPIHVEPRDGSQPVVLTPPVDGTTASPSCSVPTSTRVIPQPEVESPSTPRRRTTTQPVVFAMPAPEENHKNRRQTGGRSEDSRQARSIPIRIDSNSKESSEDSNTAPPPPSPPKDKRRQDTSQVVEEVRLDVENLRKCVAEFEGVRGDKQYLYLDEMLTRNLIRLDNISTEGNEELRKARRAVIDAINSCIQEMEQKVSAGAGTSDDLSTDVSSTVCEVEEQVADAATATATLEEDETVLSTTPCDTEPESSTDMTQTKEPLGVAAVAEEQMELCAPEESVAEVGSSSTSDCTGQTDSTTVESSNSNQQDGCCQEATSTTTTADQDNKPEA